MKKPMISLADGRITVWTREKWKEVHGEEAPPPNYDQPRQDWTGPNGTFRFLRCSDDGQLYPPEGGRAVEIYENQFFRAFNTPNLPWGSGANPFKEGMRFMPIRPLMPTEHFVREPILGAGDCALVGVVGYALVEDLPGEAPAPQWPSQPLPLVLLTQLAARLGVIDGNLQRVSEDLRKLLALFYPS